jgi:hypothetical protein
MSAMLCTGFPSIYALTLQRRLVNRLTSAACGLLISISSLGKAKPMTVVEVSGLRLAGITMCSLRGNKTKDFEITVEKRRIIP